MREIRGRDIGMVFQEPMTSLNPVLTIARQITETLEQHQGADRQTAERRALELLEMVGIADPKRRLRQYPHQLSGGMRQRVMIAVALACNPKLIIADEPTTALDVTIQAQILELMKSLTRKLGVAQIIITHNLGVVARYASRVNVMYAGRIVEAGSAEAIYHNPRHPYTMALLKSVPRLDQPRRARLDPVDGQPPDLTRLDGGCSFRPRCRFAVEQCAAARPPLAAGGRAGAFLGVLSQRRARDHPGRRRMNAHRRSRRAAASRGARPCHALPDLRGHRADAQDRRREGGRRRRFRHQARRDAGPGGRERLRQDHDRPLHPAARAADRRRDPVRRPGRQPHGAPRAGRAAPAHAGDLPGPLQLAQPAHEGGRHHCRADQGARRRAGCAAAGATR